MQNHSTSRAWSTSARTLGVLDKGTGVVRHPAEPLRIELRCEFGNLDVVTGGVPEEEQERGHLGADLGEEVPPETDEFAECGVMVVFSEGLPGGKLDGAVTFLGEGRPLIGLKRPSTCRRPSSMASTRPLGN